MTGVGLCLPQLGEGLTPDILREFCVSAEQLGYSSLWVQDHFAWPLQPRRGYAGRAGAPIPPQYRSVLSPTELLTAVATWTTTPRIGTSILVAGNHWPVPLAGRLATIDLLSGGRLTVGFGVGWSAEEHDASGTEIERRGQRMDNFVPALRACWGDDPVSHDGPFFTIPPMVLRPKPIKQPHPPLLSGMWSPAGLERTRLHFDGWNPAGMPPAASKSIADDLNARRPDGMAPLTVHHRAFAQFPLAPKPDGDAVARLAEEAAEASSYGFTDFIIEHNFTDEVADARAWLDIPERFSKVIAAADA
jgi:probable F420-dependent oxidoreductase